MELIVYGSAAAWVPICDSWRKSMPLEEAVASLRLQVQRRFGTFVQVRLIDADLNRGWHWERPLPLVLLAGKVIMRGEISEKLLLKKIQSKLAGQGL